jgi:glycosyltransferase involved in cell wall biosynthesis
MKILMILANPFTHDPRVYNEAKSILNAGHDVTVFAWDKTRKNKKIEKKDCINIVRSYNSKFMDLIIYDILRLHWWWKKGYRDALKLFKEKHFDTIHCHDLSSLPIGVKLKKKFDCKLVYDAHELWGYMISRDLPFKSWADYYLWKEKSLVKFVDNIITVNEPLEEYFKKITKKHVTVVMNAKPLKTMIYEPPKNNIFTIIYIGTLGKQRFLLELVEVIGELSNVRCIIAGMGAKKEYVNDLEEKCSQINNVDFIGKLPIKEVLPVTKEANVVFCMFDPDDKNCSVGLPNKVFEAMASGRPIIVTKDVYLGKFVEKENIGLAIPFDKKYLKEAIIRLRDNPDLCEKFGKNALDAAIREYNWKEQEKKLLEIYGV